MILFQNKSNIIKKHDTDNFLINEWMGFTSTVDLTPPVG